jgi:hypothetical protein
MGIMDEGRMGGDGITNRIDVEMDIVSMELG